VVLARIDWCRVNCLIVRWGRAGTGCWAIAICVVGRAGNWVGLLGGSWACGMLIDGLRLKVVGTVEGCWLGSAEVCSYGLELARLWWQVWVVG